MVDEVCFGEPWLWKGLVLLRLCLSGEIGRCKELPGPVSSEGSGAVRGSMRLACAFLVNRTSKNATYYLPNFCLRLPSLWDEQALDASDACNTKKCEWSRR